MKNNEKGFIVPLIIIVALIVIGGGVYIYKNKKVKTPVIIDTATQKTDTQTPPINTNQSTTIPTPYSDLSSADKKLIIDLGKDIAVKNNVNGLRDFITQYYKVESNPCGNKYVLDYIDSSTVGHIICKSNSTSYAGSSVLVSTPSASWCADSFGFSGQGTIIYQMNKYSCSPTNVPIPTMPKFTEPKTDTGSINNSSITADTIVESRIFTSKTYAENYYDSHSNSYAGFCTSDSDFKIIKDSLLPLILNCKDSATNYVISVQKSSGNYWCADSAGYSGPAKPLSTQIACVN
ncbi:MAG TPA: hypothetical protein VK675_03775 [Candidatus Paceibacterota bacterium]|nr:hypothetical protein [Candidatus Paceibacterota bacterium]